MTPKPCPCMSLQKGCKLVAIVDAVFSMVNLGLSILAFIFYLRGIDDELTESERRIGWISVLIAMIMCVLQILLAFRLYYGAINRDHRQCKIWLIITGITTIVNVASFILNVSASEIYGAYMAGAIMSLLYSLYKMFVVYAFLQELKQDLAFADSMRYTISAKPQVHPQPPPPYFTGNATTDTTPVYVIPASESQNAYPMQQYTAVNQSYPAPVHHVTIT